MRHSDVTNMRKILSHIASLAGVVGGLVTMWQAVRFCHGSIGMPEPFGSWVTPLLAKAYGPEGLLATVFHYLFGVVSWLFVGAIVLVISHESARIFELGWHRYQAQLRIEAKEYARTRRIEDARERRLAARAQKKGGGLSIGTLLIGVIVGSFFF